MQLYLVSTVELSNKIAATHTHTANKTNGDSVLACDRHKHNSWWCSVVCRCVYRSKSLRNSSCAIQNLDAMRSNAYAYSNTAYIQQTIYSQTSTFNNRTNIITLTESMSETTTLTAQKQSWKNQYINVQEIFSNSQAIKFHSIWFYVFFCLAAKERTTKNYNYIFAEITELRDACVSVVGCCLVVLVCDDEEN